jgi:phytoene desaturase
MARKIIVIGAGFSGLSAAAYLARQGFDVEILEKNAQAGGRARRLESDGFCFDMGPSWYTIPDVFDRFFAHFDSHPSNFYNLKRIDPAFRFFSSNEEYIDIPTDKSALYDLFELHEKGSSNRLDKYLKTGTRQYKLVMNSLIYKPGNSIAEYLHPALIFKLLQTKSLRSLSAYTKRAFKNPQLQRILEFPLLFMGATPTHIPAVFNLSAYSQIDQGTWYPEGGMHKVVDAITRVCQNFGVDITYNVDVDQLDILKGRVNSAHYGHRNFYGEFFVSSGDYYHTDKQLLTNSFSNYSQRYWAKRKLAPSAMIYFLGLKKPIKQLSHYNLVVGDNFEKQYQKYEKAGKWPEDPSFFVSVPSKTDINLAPEGHETLMITAPVASGLQDYGKIREHYFNRIINKLEQVTKASIREHIVYQKSYAHTDFINDYHAYKGNAYGLATTLNQLGPFRPKIRSKRLSNLFYTGHFAVPGPGVPTSIISGEIVAREIYKACGGRKS